LALQKLKSAILENSGKYPTQYHTLEGTFHILQSLYKEVSYLMLNSSVEANQVLKFNALVSWNYILMVQDGNDFAVILFAYFAILSAAIKGSWCLDKNFGRVALKYSRRIVDDKLQYLLDWAEEQCENNLTALMGITTQDISTG
jgi:hypothetical protein